MKTFILIIYKICLFKSQNSKSRLFKELLPLISLLHELIISLSLSLEHHMFLSSTESSLSETVEYFFITWKAIKNKDTAVYSKYIEILNKRSLDEDLPVLDSKTKVRISKIINEITELTDPSQLSAI